VVDSSVKAVGLHDSPEAPDFRGVDLNGVLGAAPPSCSPPYRAPDNRGEQTKTRTEPIK